jgi:hypothetical protein
VHGGHEHSANSDGSAVGILYRHLGLCVRTQPRALIGFPRICQSFRELVREQNRERHELRRFICGVAEHDALIARASHVHALSDLARLTRDELDDVHAVRVEWL